MRTAVLLLSLLLSLTFHSQKLEYVFAGKHKGNTYLKCGKGGQFVKITYGDLDMNTVTYEANDKSIALKRINRSILSIDPIGCDGDVSIIATDTKTGHRIGVITIKTYCPENYQVFLYGKVHGDTLERKNITYPFQIEIKDVNHPKNTLEIVSFGLSVVVADKYSKFKFSKLEGDLLKEVVNSLQHKKIDKFYITEVKVIKPTKDGDEIIPIVGASFKIVGK